MRIALALEYDGSEYYGWQAQAGLRTVQQVVESALSRVANEPVIVVCAGRTDTGVHALNQIIHFDSECTRSIRAWIHGTNAYLPKDVCVKWGRQMTEDFHARYSAVSRRYRYIISNTPIRPALYRRQVTWQFRQLEHELMQQAAQQLVGEHDFTSFRSMECQSRSPTRLIHDLTANAFLHHMVRNIAGVLMVIGAGKYPVEWIQEVLQAKDRRKGAETAPAYGLYFVDAAYPSQYEVTQAVFE
jgi:tRNA pseudouridine38-40 synthase